MESKIRPWTSEETQKLREVFEAEGIQKAMVSIEGRTPGSVVQKANKMGLKTAPHWSTAEDARLHRVWGELSIPKIAKLFNRTPVAIWLRAKKLKLSGCPEGYEFLSTAAKRVGVATATLRGWLKAAEVKLFPVWGFPKKRRKTRGEGLRNTRQWLVDTYDVDEVVNRWLDTESLIAAATRRGMSAEKLKTRLVAAGHTPPPFKVTWRLPTKDIDNALACWEASQGETLKVAAARHGVRSETLSKLLVRAGVTFKKGRLGSIAPTVVDEVVAKWRQNPLCRFKPQKAIGRAA